MGWQWKYIAFFLIASVVSVRRSGGERIYFMIAQERGPATSVSNACVIPISKPADISCARELIAQNSKTKFPVFRVAWGKDGVNRDYRAPGAPEWSWHGTEFLGFAEGTSDIGADAQFVENRFEVFADEGYRVSFISYIPVAEMGQALDLSAEINELNVVFRWPEISTNRAYTVIGTNFVYTLESSASLASTNWTAAPGGSWPAKTNQWTLPKAGVENRFFRVRAEPRR